MKHSLKTIKIIGLLVFLLIAAYQTYWLTDIYTTLTENLQKDINEAMRSADFEEINDRVNTLRQQGYGGTMSVSVGSEDDHQQVGVKNEYHGKSNVDENNNNNSLEKSNDQPLDRGANATQTTNSANDQSTNLQDDQTTNNVPYDEFSDALKDEEALRRVGLYMQKGIHDGLDAIIPLCSVCYDSLLCIKLDSLGVNRKHTTLYLEKNEAGFDTVKVLGEINITKADTFRLSLNTLDDKQYVLLLEKRIITIPQKMHSALLFSFFTLLMLILAFLYILRMIKRMRALDEMKSDFTNNITHELKTPIAVAYAANDALLNFGDNNNPEKIRKYLTICQEQLVLLTQLVEQILSLSMEKRNSMKLEIEPLPLASIVDKLVENQQLKSPKPLTVSCDIPTSLNVMADKIHLNNILNNLIDNAIKYSNESIHIDIKAKRQVDGKIAVTIADNGIGISADQQRYIFDKFYRVPHGNVHKVKGYGLGLYYVKTMIEKLGGSVSLQSEEGKGTTFRLLFNGED